MARRGRPGLSARQKKELWSRWRRGQSLSEIGRALGKHAGSIYGVLAASGGITPSTRTRSDHVLSLREREEFSRNGGRLKYRAARADDRAWAKAKRPKESLLRIDL